MRRSERKFSVLKYATKIDVARMLQVPAINEQLILAPEVGSEAVAILGESVQNH